MAIKKSNGKYACSYCHKEYALPTQADICRDGHDLVYVQLSREDVVRLLQFIATGEYKLLRPSLIRDLRRYARIKIKADEETYLPDMQQNN